MFQDLNFGKKSHFLYNIENMIVLSVDHFLCSDDVCERESFSIPVTKRFTQFCLKKKVDAKRETILLFS